MALSVQLRLLAPFISFTAEEAWSWWNESSIHRSQWPTTDELQPFIGAGNIELLALASQTLSEVRRAKSEAKQSMKAVAREVTVANEAGVIEMLREVEDDLLLAGVIEKLIYEVGDPAVRVTLAE